MVEERLLEGAGILLSQACTAIERGVWESDPSLLAEGDGHARFGSIEVLEGCGSPSATLVEVVFAPPVVSYADVLEKELESSPKTESITGFA